MSKSINFQINNVEYKSDQPSTILEFCKNNDINIPTLCHHPDLPSNGNCRLCVVEIANQDKLQSACTTPLQDKISIYTDSNKVRHARKAILELLLASHDSNCTECSRNLNCELQILSQKYGINEIVWNKNYKENTLKDLSSPVFERDNKKCVICGRCVEACNILQGVHAIDKLGKGYSVKIGSAFNKPISETVCINCGQCVAHCPTAALTEKNHINEVLKALEDKSKTVVIQTAPAIRAALGELFGYPPGTRVSGKMVNALKTVGFDYVFDTQFAADLTIMEEGFELLSRLKSKLKDGKEAVLPMTTSCSPGWIKYAEHFYPKLLPHLSTCKSPQQMMGTILKTYWAQKVEIDPTDIVSVSIMPCTAKKFEASRPEMTDSGYRDVDYVLTTREAASLIKMYGIDLKKVSDAEFDHPLGESTGAGTIFGATGGVMEAALRTAYEVITGEEVPFGNLDITPVRGMDEIKEASIKIDKTLPQWNFLEGVELKVAVAYGTANAKKILDIVNQNKDKYHFIEIMTCPGGCLGGGGQPLPVTPEIREARAKAIYEEDHSLNIRKSHENPAVKKLYEDFLIEPNSHLAHKLLHTDYVARGRY